MRHPTSKVKRIDARREMSADYPVQVPVGGGLLLLVHVPITACIGSNEYYIMYTYEYYCYR